MRRLLTALAGMSLLLAVLTPAVAAGESVDERLADLALDAPIVLDGVDKIGRSLLSADGKVRVSIRLSEDALTTKAAAGFTRGALRSHARAIADQQAAFQEALDAAGARTLATTSKVLNAVFVEADAAALWDLAAHEAVVSIKPVVDYQLDLSETVPYIGAAAVQSEDGYDGSGVTVAVLDSGIDYYHAALGGSGDTADYDADDPTVVETGTFPTAKVIGGYDFIGSTWAGGGDAEEPDPDPIDDGPQAGHGTHVAHIIAGEGGVAPGASLYAVKVCSSVSTSCSGISLIQGMEFAVDPDGDGDPSDHVDIINMSLGSPYGQAFDDDLSLAVDNASAVGVLTVASAGNSADKPYITGSPAAAPTALSVAQTQVPSAVLQLITDDSTGDEFPAVFQPWSVPLADGDVIAGPIQYGDLDGSNLNGCAPFTGDLSGLVVLVDRGACNFTLKISNISQAGGAVGIIGLVAPGAPFSGGDGGDRPIDIPGFMIDQADASALKASAASGGTATIDENNGIPLVGQMVGSSSRGPSMQFNSLIKPEIGAPGASVSAIAGSGTDEGPFGGTSGAAPMVAGSAALVLQANSDLSPAEVKSLLVNTGDTEIDTDPFSGLAPITRIGGGEVRVDRAIRTSAAAWDADAATPALSFGFVDAHEDVSMTKTVIVTNYGASDVTYDIVPTFRYDDDATGAVTPSLSTDQITVPAGGSETFELTLSIDADALDDWTGSSGPGGADPRWLTDLEYDGYLWLDAADDADDIHLPWHVLPRKSADVMKRAIAGFSNKYRVKNTGAATAQIEAYNLVAVSGNLPEGARGAQNPITDFRAVGMNAYPVPDWFCTNEVLVQFAVTTWERQTHANAPNAHDLYLDFNGDGIPEANVFNYELSFGLADGRNVTIGVDLTTGAGSIFFFTSHATNSANTVLTVCGEQIGLTLNEVNTMRTAIGGAFDLYFTGNYTDFFGSKLTGNFDAPVRVPRLGRTDFLVLEPGQSVRTTVTGKGALLLVNYGADGAEALILRNRKR